MFRVTSSVSNDVDEDDDRVAELDLDSGDVLDPISTISAMCELELPSRASEVSSVTPRFPKTT